jgi:hypothetical protein
VDNDYNSALVINPTEQKIHTVSFSETILEKKQVIKDSELILYLSLHRLDYEIIKKGSNVRYAKKPIGYNYNFSSTTNTTCFEIQGKEGNLDDYWSKYPFHILLTLGIQIPFSILDYISLPIRMYPYYNYDRNSYEIKKLIKKTKLNPKNFAPFRILYYNEKGEKIYVGEFQNGRANLKRKNLLIFYALQGLPMWSQPVVVYKKQCRPFHHRF